MEKLVNMGLRKVVGLAAMATVACRDYTSNSPESRVSGGSGSAGLASADSVGGYDGVVGGAGNAGGGDRNVAPASGNAGASPSDDGGYSGVPSGGAAGISGTGLGGGGVGGEEPTAGDAGSSQSGAPVSTRPFCETGPQGHPVIGLTASKDISVARTQARAPFVIFTSQPTNQVVALSWSFGLEWVKWSCFDAVPSPQRLASGNGPDGMLQVYATTLEGKLFARQQGTAGYLSWQLLRLPTAAAAASDVATVDGAFSTLYLATGPAGVFARARLRDETQLVGAAWYLALGVHAVRVAATALDDDRHEIAAIDANGRLTVASQVGLGRDAAFRGEGPADASKKFVDVDFARNSLGQVQTFAVLADGSVVVRTLVDSVWSDWTTVGTTQAGPRLTSIAAGTLSGQPPFLFGIGDYSLPYYSTNAGIGWAPRF